MEYKKEKTTGLFKSNMSFTSCLYQMTEFNFENLHTWGSKFK